MSSFDVQTLKDRLLVKYPAFASAIANANYYEKPVKTLCTDGKDIYYSPNFLNSLSFDEQLFVLAHEICHIRSNHILRSKDKNPKLWNIATDAVINTLLKDDGLLMPQKAVNMPDAIHYSAEEYYEKLLKEQEQNENSFSEEKQSQSEQTQSSGSNGEEDSKKQNQEKSSQGTGEDEEYNNPSNVDDHSMWSKTLEKESEENGRISKENIETVDEQDLFSQNRKEKIENLKKLKEEILESSMQAGNSTNSEHFSLNNIGGNKPLIDWRTLLRKSINVKLRWDTRRPDVEYGVLVPKLKRKAYPRTEILLDTSGSIDDEMLKNFLRECKYILQNTEMWVGCFDTKFYGFQKIDTEEDIDKMTFYGRGGTNFEVAVNAFTKKSDNKIIFTDGYADMPKEKVNAIWVVFGENKINPLGGQVLYISQEQLKQLHPSSNSMKK